MIMANSYENDENLYKLLKRLVHDLRSPLSGLFMWLHGTDSRLPTDEKEALKRIATRMQDSLDGASFAADKRDVIISSLNIHNLIQDMIQEKKIEYMGYDVKFTYNVPENYQDININVVKDDFSRMLSNLINNAVEACSGQSGAIRIGLHKSNNIITITINDNGRGIPVDVLQMLRDGKTITHGKTSGHGIGMQQIGEVITKLNGTLDIRSMLGQGSTFTIIFSVVSE